jgi:hypothetical protein
MKEIVMTTLDVNRYSMFVRVTEFGAAHRDRFPAAGPAGQLFAAISQAVDQLGAHVIAQAAGKGAARDGDLSKAAARDALRQALDAIARTARALDTGTPGLGGKFQLPSSRNDHELTTAAHLFGRQAAPLKAEFVAHGLPKTFLADLQAALDAFERATQDRFGARQTGAAARAGIRTAVGSALGALGRLDAIVLNTLRDEPTLLAAWTSARHVTKPRTGGERAPAAASPVTPAVPAAPSPDAGTSA